MTWDNRESNVCDSCGNDTPEPVKSKGKVLCPGCAPKSKKKVL